MRLHMLVSSYVRGGGYREIEFVWLYQQVLEAVPTEPPSSGVLLISPSTTGRHSVYANALSQQGVSCNYLSILGHEPHWD